MTDLFSAIKDGQEYEVDICPVTNKAHRYKEGETTISEILGRKYQYLYCKDCGYKSSGWIPLGDDYV